MRRSLAMGGSGRSAQGRPRCVQGGHPHRTQLQPSSTTRAATPGRWLRGSSPFHGRRDDRRGSGDPRCWHTSARRRTRPSRWPVNGRRQRGRCCTSHTPTAHSPVSVVSVALYRRSSEVPVRSASDMCRPAEPSMTTPTAVQIALSVAVVPSGRSGWDPRQLLSRIPPRFGAPAPNASIWARVNATSWVGLVRRRVLVVAGRVLGFVRGRAR